MTGLLADQYRDAAENIAAQAITFHLTELLTCDPVDEGQAYCAAVFIRDIGGNAFRRPLTEDELERYWAIWDVVATEDGFIEGLQWTLTALLQSPHFIYRMELGALNTDEAHYALTDWEVASQLSYLFWDTLPDEGLRNRAANGELHTEAQIQEEVVRMLADPRANRVMDGFVEQWLHLDRLIKVPKIMQVYPDLTFSVRGEMLRETQKLASTLMSDAGTLSDLLQAEHSYMTDELATYYGLPAGDGAADSEGFRRIDLQGTPYGGLLAQGSLLTTFARPDSSSPIHRGVLVRERLLCQHPPPPPQIWRLSRQRWTRIKRLENSMPSIHRILRVQTAMSASIRLGLVLSILMARACTEKWMVFTTSMIPARSSKRVVHRVLSKGFTSCRSYSLEKMKWKPAT